MNKWLYASLCASPQPAGVELPHCVPDVGLQLLVLGPQLVPVTPGRQDSLLTQGQCLNTGILPYYGLLLVETPTSAFTFKTLLRHYAKRTLTHGK